MKEIENHGNCQHGVRMVCIGDKLHEGCGLRFKGPSIVYSPTGSLSRVVCIYGLRSKDR